MLRYLDDRMRLLMINRGLGLSVGGLLESESNQHSNTISMKGGEIMTTFSAVRKALNSGKKPSEVVHERFLTQLAIFKSS